MFETYTADEIDALIAAQDGLVGALTTRVGVLESGGAMGNGGFSPWVDARAFGVSKDNPDNTGALQAAIDAAWANSLRKVYLPASLFKITAEIDVSGVRLEGPGPLSGCGIMQMTQGKGAVTIKGERNGVHAPGGGLLQMGIFAAPGVQCGYAIAMGSGGQNVPDRVALDGLRITTGPTAPTSTHGTWHCAIYANGTTRLAPPGFRGMTIRDVEFFNVRSPGIVLWGVNGLRMSGVNGYTAQGVQAYTGIWIGGTSSVQSTDVQASDCHVEGQLNVTNTVNSGFEGHFYGGVYMDAFSQQTCVVSVD